MWNMKKLSNGIKDIFNRIFSNPVHLTVLIVVGIFIFAFCSFCWTKYVSKSVFQTEELNYSKNPYYDMNAFISQIDVRNLNGKIAQRLYWQYNSIKNKEKYHLNVVDYFHSQYYTATLAFSICCIIAALMLFVISKKGWSNTPQHILTAFLVFAAASIYLGNSPSFFKMEDNIKENQNTYKSYCKMENDMLTFIATYKQDTSLRNPDSLAVEFLKSVDAQLYNLNFISTGIDISKVKTTTDALQSFKTENDKNK